ncbi:MAG: hypothetical protein JO108_28900 [Acidobacteriaceae bacterium]|nr:hypothetical protein [Acidobacteriaceae bacterium]
MRDGFYDLSVKNLTRPAKVLFRFGLILLGASTVAVSVIGGIWLLRGLNSGLNEWSAVHLFLGLAGLIAILLSGRTRSLD